VDLFFVLSGFLITTILMNTVGKPRYLKNFYGRRMLRILPLYYLVLVVAIIIFPSLGLFQKQLQYCVDHQLWYWAYLQNWLYALHPATETHLLGHLWSLAVEEQFYIVWPFIILFVRKPKPLLIVALGILLAVMGMRIYFFIYHSQDFNYTLTYTFTRIDGLCIGSMVAILHKINFGFLSKNIAAVVISLAAINFIFYFVTYHNRSTYPYYFFVGYTTFTAMFGLLVHEIASRNTAVLNYFFSLRLFRFLGRISYGLYVYHWPLYVLLFPVLVKRFSGTAGDPGFIANMVSAAVVTLIAVVLSILSYFYFERYFLRLKKNFV
jgi:peptidoglycan/LPS O-acetylase OafA/YrhL